MAARFARVTWRPRGRASGVAWHRAASRNVDASHAGHDRGGPANDVRRARALFESLRRRQHDGELRRLLRAERGNADAEIALRGSGGTEDAFAPLDFVEVDLEDAPFAQDRLELPGED